MLLALPSVVSWQGPMGTHATVVPFRTSAIQNTHNPRRATASAFEEKPDERSFELSTIVRMKVARLLGRSPIVDAGATAQQRSSPTVRQARQPVLQLTHASEPRSSMRPWLVRLLDYVVKTVATDLCLWRAHFYRALNIHRRAAPRQPAALPDVVLPEGWHVLCDPATGSCYYVNPEGEATWTPPAQPSALAPTMWICDDEECTVLPESAPASSSSVSLPAGPWNARTTAAVQQRASSLMRKADAAIEASRIGRRWESYCAFPKHVVSATAHDYVARQRQVVWKGHCVFPEHVVVGSLR